MPTPFIVYLVKYVHYEDNDTFSAWTTRELAERALAAKIADAQPTWDKHCYNIEEVEVSA